MDGNPITYDAIGNPLTYYDGRQFTWAEGRRLESVTENGQTTQYRYNAEGIRTRKIFAGGTWIKYILADGRPVGEITYAANGSASRYLKYAFDENGAPTGFSVWDNDANAWIHYYLMKNLQGDVLRVYRAADSALVASYTYDSWGNILTATGDLANINPFRYRGYYYDTETGLYYLQSRYYNPQIGRFLNADAFASTAQGILGFNMFAYCTNNPIIGCDPSGFWNWSGFIAGIGIALGAVVAVATFGVGSPIGALIAGAAIATGVSIACAAATDSTFVADMSYSTPLSTATYAKVGVSIITDFKENTTNAYTHSGGGIGKSSGPSYSVGIVSNYEEPTDYSNSFVDVSVGYYFGIDHCWTPNDGLVTSTQATCVTFSSGISYGVGYDYYSQPICIFE